MRTTAGTGQTPHTRGLWCAAVFLVLAGLFGMHGLEDHGTADMTAGMGATGVSRTATPSEDSRGLALTTHLHQGKTAELSADTRAMQRIAWVGSPSGGGGHTMAGLCLAVLTMALLSLLTLRRRAVRGVGLAVVLPPVSKGGTGRDRDPPSLNRLSIRRC